MTRENTFAFSTCSLFLLFFFFRVGVEFEFGVSRGVIGSIRVELLSYAGWSQSRSNRVDPGFLRLCGLGLGVVALAVAWCVAWVGVVVGVSVGVRSSVGRAGIMSQLLRWRAEPGRLILLKILLFRRNRRSLRFTGRRMISLSGLLA